jgi:hypothetical protein
MLAAPKVSLQYSINLGHQHTSAWRTHNSCPSCDDVHIPFRLIGKGKTNVLVYSRFKFVVVNARKLGHVTSAGPKPDISSVSSFNGRRGAENGITFALWAPGFILEIGIPTGRLCITMCGRYCQGPVTAFTFIASGPLHHLWARIHCDCWPSDFALPIPPVRVVVSVHARPGISKSGFFCQAHTTWL